MSKSFNYHLADAQATPVEPLSPAQFDFDLYAEYDAARTQRCREFWAAEQGVLVYRRFRVAEVFAAGCADMRQSLAWQLGALARSVQFEADVPNFLEPWYGIATVASSFGADYAWPPDQAPVAHPPFRSTEQALAAETIPVAETPIGRKTLEYIDYFLEETGGRVPMSLTDTQSPLNTATNLVEVNQFFMDFIMNPEGVRQLIERAVDLLVDFTRLQAERIGPALVWPGHGFASSRAFEGLGMSDDQLLMLSDDLYRQFAMPAMARAGAAFGGPVFHSCGNWSAKAPMIREMPGLRMLDGAFSTQTDPDPNPAEVFPPLFAGSGIVVNARIVGDVDLIESTVRRLWRPGMKLVVVTYCETPEEQAEAHARIHATCEG